MNKVIRKKITNKLNDLGVVATENIYKSNRLDTHYDLEIKDLGYVTMNVTNSFILITQKLRESTICSCGLVLETGKIFGYNKDSEAYIKLNELIYEIRDMLNIPIPTIIL